MKTDRVHVFHHAICEALINVSLSLQHRLLAETLQPVLSHPLPPSLHLSFLLYPPSSSLVNFSPSPLLTQSLLPPVQSRGTGAGGCRWRRETCPRVFSTRGVKFELGWEWNPHSFAETMRACVCLCVPAAFNVMLIQFIFNEETVSSYREAKEISGLLHSGKSIAHLFILLFELFVCLKNKPSGYAAKISVASKSFNSFVHTVCVCVCVRTSLQRKITTSLTAM